MNNRNSYPVLYRQDTTYIYIYQLDTLVLSNTFLSYPALYRQDTTYTSSTLKLVRTLHMHGTTHKGLGMKICMEPLTKVWEQKHFRVYFNFLNLCDKWYFRSGGYCFRHFSYPSRQEWGNIPSRSRSGGVIVLYFLYYFCNIFVLCFCNILVFFL